VFFIGIAKILVTLMDYLDMWFVLEPTNRLKDSEMKQKSLFYLYTGRDRSKWFISFALNLIRKFFQIDSTGL